MNYLENSKLGGEGGGVAAVLRKPGNGEKKSRHIKFGGLPEMPKKPNQTKTSCPTDFFPFQARWFFLFGRGEEKKRRKKKGGREKGRKEKNDEEIDRIVSKER